MSELLRGRALPEGGLIAVTAPASPSPDPGAVDAARSGLEALGFRVRLGAHVRERDGYLAGSAAGRAADLNDAFADPEVDAIMPLRGGFGSAHLLPLLDAALARSNPKPLIGMSDVTMLHAWLAACGVASLWGPNARGLADGTPYTRAAFTAATVRAEVGPIVQAPDGPELVTITPGAATGRLVGGTTSLLVTTLGTPWEVSTRGRIVLLEDVGERPYRIDRMLTHLLQAGKLGDAAAIVVGEHSGCEPEARREAFATTTAGGPPTTLAEVVGRVLGPLGVPCFQGLAIGHGASIATLPFGSAARVDAGACLLEVLEPGVLAR